MADTSFVVERKNSDVEAEGSGTEKLEFNSDSGWQESEWIRKIQSGLEMARSDQNAWGDVRIKRLPAIFRKPVELYTPRQWQFGLHNRDPQASSSESEDLKISLAAACKLNPDQWDKFCADVVDNPADMMLKSYGIYSSVTKLSPKEVQYQLTLDALTLVLVLSSISRVFDQRYQKAHVADQRLLLPKKFIGSLVTGGFNIEAVMTDIAVGLGMIYDDLFLCENQIPMALMRKAISKCYGLLPEERKSNDYNLGELENLDSDVTLLLDRILKLVANYMCIRFFAEPCPNKKDNLFNLIDLNYKVGELENCAHILACIHKVMTSCVSMPPIATFTTTSERAKQSFWRAVATRSKKLATIIATIFGFSRKTETGVDFGIEPLPSATVLKKAGIRIQGIPGMLQEVAFKNGCLFLPIILQSTSLESYICNMAAYETWNTSGPFPFCNYLQLMKYLIKTPEDVSYLIDCDVIRADHSTEERIFQMWQLIRVYYYPRYSLEYRKSIVQPINKHCASPLNKMLINFYNTFCSKPWFAISVISPLILVATLIQTYVLITGSDKMQPHFPRGG
ncbi:hypothetical protein CY35_08G139700 [Sphagnum magellanicum]|nr:hypothetical protein CY35_08G139700 [Sphagnum magellanicum]